MKSTRSTRAESDPLIESGSSNLNEKQPNPKMNTSKLRLVLLAAALASFAALNSVPAQTVTDPCPNRVISWNLDDTSTVNPTDLAGLAPALNWVDSWLNNITIGLPDNAGNPTTLDLGWASFNTWHVQGSHPGLDANGTANREILNGYLNSGPAAWNPSITNTYVSLTNIPYALYDVVVYFNSDTSGRHGSIDNGSTTYYFSTVGGASRSGANALFLPTTETNSTKFPSADFAFFPGMTSANAIFTEFPKSGNDQWLGIAAFQVIEASNTYVLYGPTPASQIVPIGQPAAFSVIAGGQNPQYQWRHAGTDIPNATNATYSIGATSSGQDGNYDVVVFNSFSSITSSVATLVFYAPKTLEWGGTGSTWDTTSTFWNLNGSAAAYTETDNVRFGPLGAVQSYVTLNETFAPSSITVSNASYTFASGGLSGNGSLRLRNNATLILDTADTRSGATVIDSGSVLQLDNNDTAGALGSGALTNNGALVFNAGGDEAYGYPIYGTGNITNISQVGRITLGNDLHANYLVEAGLTGGSDLLLQGNNSFTGGIIVSSGTVLARSLGALGNAPVTLTGGSLELYFNFDYVAPSVTLAGGLLHGIGDNTFEGTITLATDSEIMVDNILRFPNAGVNGGSFNLTKSGGGTLTLGGTNFSWGSLIINAGTVAFASGANPTLSTPVTGGGNLSQIGTGTLTLTGDNSAMSGLLTVSNGTLLVNTTSAASLASAYGGTLGGNGSIAGPVTIESGATLAPGSASIGTLTLGSDLTLNGNVLVKVNTSLAQSNDLVTVSGTLVNNGAGVVTVNNLGPALAAGDSFKLFSQAVTGGETLSITGAGAIWTNKLAIDGTIQVLTASIPQPRIVSSAIVGTTLVLSGTNGLANGSYQVLSSTNIATPLANWTSVASGTFGSSGQFSVTNAIAPNEPQRFYLLKQP